MGAGMRMLVVDDEESILFSIGEFFRSKGLEVDTAKTIEDAEAFLAAGTYDVVIADLRLTGIEGAEGLEIISFVRERSSATKVILLTAYGTPEIEAEAKQRGANAFLQKPQPLANIARIVSSFNGD